ncbi:MAG TPA: alpha-hydroxy acid oxidase [Steroidobacteraceae bacterium]|nr:alpha-hydroxy acid oxidase [Steroidobacteraceae bacterium]
MPIANSIEDLRLEARRRVPRAIFDYADRGSYDEVTFDRNLADLRALQFRQRVMVDVSAQQLKTQVLGEDWAIPLGIGPTGLTGLFHANGEMLGARAAQAFGVPFCLSTMSICSIEDVAGFTNKPFWFQVYLMRDRGFNAELLDRAKAANCSAIMLTVDMPVQGLRRRDPKNGLSIPPRLTLKNMFEVAMRPGWAFKVLTGKRRTFGNLEARLKGTGGLKTLSEWIGQQFDPTVTWKDLAWLRERWPRKIILKGVLDAEDARLAVQNGVDAIVVSNHGGRQLDGTRSTISALPHVVDAVAGGCDVLFDGGVRCGQDVLKALALGAKGCLIGKAFLYALAARGEAGVTLALEIIRKELAVSLALTGANDVSKVSRDILVPRN